MKKILIIEQDAFFGNIIEQKLKDESYEVIIVRSGVVALEQVHLAKPDLIILDMELTGADPFAILKGKQDDKGLKEIPTIIISRSGDLSEIKSALNLGVKDYLVKAQLNLDDFILKIKNQLNKPKQSNDSTNAFRDLKCAGQKRLSPL